MPMKVKASDFKETTYDHMNVKRRKARQATGESKLHNMGQRNKRDIDFEDHTFALKQGNRRYSPADHYTKQPGLTLGNVSCILPFPNNISSLLGTTIKNNNDKQNIVDSVNHFLH